MAIAHTAVRPEGNTAGRLPDGTAARFNATADDCECCDEGDGDGGVPGVICSQCIFEIESITLTVGGVANHDPPDCADCTNVNGFSAIATRDFGDCHGLSPKSERACGLEYNYTWEVYSDGTDYVLDVLIWEDDITVAKWQKKIPLIDGKADCTLFDGNIPIDYAEPLAKCDFTNATMNAVVNLEAAPP